MVSVVRIVIIGYNTIMLANMAPIKPSLKEIIAQVFPHITKGTVMSFSCIIRGNFYTNINLSFYGPW